MPMKKEFSAKWKASSQPRKQRKYAKNAPLHIKGKMLGMHLSKELRKKYSTRSVRARKGDRVKIVTGQFRGKTGKIDRIDLRKTRVFVENIEVIKKDGSKVAFPLHPSNLMITEINADDKMRMRSLEAKK
jgi:large subunit ribosomal protein L24